MKITNEVKTALLVIGAIVLLVFGYSFLKGNNLLESNRTFYAVYDEVEGLAKSSKVTINGLQVGSITDITFLNDKGQLLVTMNIHNEFEFSEKSIARVYGGDLIGGKSMAIIPSYQGEKAKSGDTLKGDIEEGLLELVNDKLTPLQQKIESAVVSADSLLTSLNKTLDNETRQDLQASIKSLNKTMASFSGSAESLDMILTENRPKLNRTFTNLDEMAVNFNQISDTISKIKINKMFKEFEGVMQDFKQISSDLNNGEGTAGKLLKDDKVYDNLDRATKQLEELMQDIKLNPKRYIHFSVFGKKAEPYQKPEDSLK